MLMVPTKPEVELHFLENLNHHAPPEHHQYMPKDLEEIKEDEYQEDENVTSPPQATVVE
jgi:hypothetical protein